MGRGVKTNIKPSKRSRQFQAATTRESDAHSRTPSETEQKLYDLVGAVMSVLSVSRILRADAHLAAAGHSFKTEGKVLVRPGWLAIYGRQAQDETAEGPQSLVPVKAGETPLAQTVEPKGLKTRPPARYSEATLLGAMEGAGKMVEDDELREAMQEKGLGTPATRAAIIEGLINEKYMLREGRELIPTAKAFQLMTLLRGLGVEELVAARTDPGVGIQALADGARQARSRGVHAADRRNDEAHRPEGEGVRPR